jgi:apolipoprotein N-acyltransferase
LLPPLPEPRPGAEQAVLLQPNISQSEQWTPVSIAALRDRLAYISLEAALRSGHSPPSLIVWPEVPAPLYYHADAVFREQVTQLARLARTNLLFGTVAHTPDGAPLNSAVMLDPGGNFVGRYDKMFLVPFGEFVPPLFGFVNRITTEAGDFAEGKRLVVFPVRGRSAGVFICYEAVFPHLVRRFAASGAEVFVNISNDGYFGRTAARQQHLKIVRMRAAENRRWILRSTNDGITVAIDPAGRIVSAIPPYQEIVLRAAYSFERDLTLYTRYGDWFVWLCAGVALVALGCSLPVRRSRLRAAS